MQKTLSELQYLLRYQQLTYEVKLNTFLQFNSKDIWINSSVWLCDQFDI